MNKKEKAKRDSVFSWNDQSANIHTVTWESGRKLNIKMYEKKWKTVQSLITRNRTKKSNLYGQTKSSRYVRKLRYSMDINANQENSIDMEEFEKKRKIAREVKLQKHLSDPRLDSPKINGNIFYLMNMYIHVCIIYASGMNCTQSPAVLNNNILEGYYMYNVYMTCPKTDRA